MMRSGSDEPLVSWEQFIDEDGHPAVVGSDGGLILTDEEYQASARITLESYGDESSCGITCGIYGWMMHTCRFPTIGEGQKAYHAMKRDLAVIVGMIPNRSDPELDAKCDLAIAAISRFVDEFP